MKRALAFLLLLAGPGAVAAQDKLSADRRELARAKAASAEAAARSAALARAAAVERDAAEKARTEELAVATRVRRAEADLAAAEARVRIVDALLAERRRDLAERQAPVARMLGALGTMARQPSIATVARPGSLDDLVHLRAVLGSVTPVVRARTAALRRELVETRRLRADAGVAAGALAQSRAALVRERQSYANLVASHAGRADSLRRRALAQSDQAIALGETARDLVDRMDQASDAAATARALAALTGPPGTASADSAVPAYRLPVTGRLLTGFGEVSRDGVRARGLTFAVAPGAGVTAPAAGRVAFARRFRGYGVVVILDHGGGWRSALTALAAASVRAGAQVAAGDRVGIAGRGSAPTVTVELYRRGRPVDIAALIS